MPKKFNERVWALICRIPPGRVATYNQLAIALGRPKAARAVGNSCKKSPGMPKVPCHRVIKSDASLGGFSKGVSKKAALLGKEGVTIKNNKVLEFSERLFKFR